MFGPMMQQTERARIANENRERDVKAAFMVRDEHTQPVTLATDLRPLSGSLNGQQATLKPQVAHGK